MAAHHIHAPELKKTKSPIQDALSPGVLCVPSLNELRSVSTAREAARARLKRISSSRISLFSRHSSWTKRQAGMNRYVSTAPASARIGWFRHTPQPSMTMPHSAESTATT